MKVCSIEDCFDNRHARGWCNKHYQRWWNHYQKVEGVSVAEKRAEHEASGEPWPVNDNGVEMVWTKANRKGGGHWEDREKIAVSQKIYADAHKEEARVQYAVRRQKLKALGLCIADGKKKATGWGLCDEHRLNNRRGATLFRAKNYVSTILRNPEPIREDEVVGYIPQEIMIVNERKW